MINELEIIKYLIQEIEQEKTLFDEYKSAERKAEYNYEKDKKEGKKVYYWDYFQWNKRIPNKSLINENLKKIRKLCLKLYD